MFLFLSKPNETGYCRINRLNSKIEFDGIVVSKQKDIWNHANEFLKISRNQSFEWHDETYQERSFYDLIYVGDSIIKNKGRLEIQIIRSDTTFVIDLSFPCKKDR